MRPAKYRDYFAELYFVPPSLKLYFIFKIVCFNWILGRRRSKELWKPSIICPAAVAWKQSAPWQFLEYGTAILIYRPRRMVFEQRWSTIVSRHELSLVYFFLLWIRSASMVLLFTSSSVGQSCSRDRRTREIKKIWNKLSQFLAITNTLHDTDHESEK